jgi:hypothetical protein
MHMSTFSTPKSGGGGSGFSLGDHDGQLLLIIPTGWADQIATEYGPSDALECDVALLSGDAAGTTFPDSLIFQSLRNGLKRQMGELVLGRLGRGEKKPGRDAPWILTDPTDEDIAGAERWTSSDDGAAFVSNGQKTAAGQTVTKPVVQQPTGSASVAAGKPSGVPF